MLSWIPRSGRCLLRPLCALENASFHAPFYMKFSTATSPPNVPPHVSSKNIPTKSKAHELLIRNENKAVGELYSVDHPVPEDKTLESFEKYVLDPTRSIDEVLSIDIRALPATAQLTCLEAVLQLSRADQLYQQSGSNKARDSKAYKLDYWPRKYLTDEHESRRAEWQLGINPLLPHNTDKCDWLHSPQFELLLLTTVASTNRLPLSRQLHLVGHLHYLWPHFDPKVYASVLRLLTTEINEFGLYDVIRLSTLLRDIPAPVQSNLDAGSDETTTSIANQATTPSLQTLHTEADLLRSAIRISALSKLASLESIDACSLLNLIDALQSNLSQSERSRLLVSVESSLIVDPRQQSLYTLAFICTRLSILKQYRRSLLNRCLGQLRRKLLLAQRFPGTDQSQWLFVLLTILANLHVGSPQSASLKNARDAVDLFAVPPVMPNARLPDPNQWNPDTVAHAGINLGTSLTADWVQSIFTDLTGYLGTRLGNANVELLNASVSHAAAYSLALLGYRATSLLEQAYNASANKKTTPVSDNMPPYVSLADHLVGPTSMASRDSINLQSVAWLPRFDWQLYYHLAAEWSKSHDVNAVDTDSSALARLYMTSKSNTVNSLVQRLRVRLSDNSQLKMLPFHRIQLSTDPPRACFSGVTKIATCIVYEKRDSIVNRPLDTLLTTYRDNSARIPVLAFDHSTWSQMIEEEQRVRSDAFLTEVARVMRDSVGVQTEELKTWSVAEVIDKVDGSV